MNLHTKRKKALSQSRSNWRSAGIRCWLVDLHRVIQREVLLIGEFIFREEEGPVDRPFQHVYPGACGAGVSEPFKSSFVNVEKSAAHSAVRIIVPRCRIGSGTRKHAHYRVGSGLEPKVRAVDGFEAAGVGEIHAAN